MTHSCSLCTESEQHCINAFIRQKRRRKRWTTRAALQIWGLTPGIGDSQVAGLGRASLVICPLKSEDAVSEFHSSTPSQADGGEAGQSRVSNYEHRLMVATRRKTSLQGGSNWPGYTLSFQTWMQEEGSVPSTNPRPMLYMRSTFSSVA